MQIKKVVFHPWFKRQLQKLDADHLEIILKDFEKIEKWGLSVLKTLKRSSKYVLAEAKHRRPPYRLYVIIDEEKDVYMLVEWSHKNKQQKTIQFLSKNIEKIVPELSGSSSRQ